MSLNKGKMRAEELARRFPTLTTKLEPLTACLLSAELFMARARDRSVHLSTEPTLLAKRRTDDAQVCGAPGWGSGTRWGRLQQRSSRSRSAWLRPRAEESQGTRRQQPRRSPRAEHG